MIYGYKRRRLFILIISTVLLCSGLLIAISSNTVHGIAMEDRIDEFNELTDLVEENYLPLEIYTKDYEVLKDVSIGKIKESTENSEHAVTLYFYLSRFNQWRTTLVGDATLAANHYYTSTGVKSDNPILKEIVSSPSVQRRNRLFFSNYKEIEERYLKSLENKNPAKVFSIEDVEPGKIAYLKMYTFDLSDGEVDDYKEALELALQEFDDYEKLMIDLRGCQGYNNKLWQEAIVPMLISETIVSDSHALYKGEDAKAYYDELGFESLAITDDNRDLYPPAKDLNASYVLLHQWSTEASDMHINVDEIYMIADNTTYKSGVNFVEFSKNTGFAKIVGEVTRARQTVYEPMYHALPSGYVVSLEPLMPINSDHQINFYYGTTPDYPLDHTYNKVGNYDKAIQYIIDLP